MTEFTTWRSLVDGERISAIPDDENLQHHYDATLIPGDDEDRIETWGDQAGDDDLTQTTESDQPRLRTGANGINNEQVLEGDGTEFMDVDWTQIGQPITIYLVAESASDGSNKNVFEMEPTAGDTARPQLQQWRDGDDDLIFAGSNLQGQNSTTNPHIFTIIFNGSNSLIRRDGSDDVSGDAGDTGDEGLTVFGRRDGADWDGKIGEIFIYDTDHDTSTQQDVEAYLDDKWAILP